MAEGKARVRALLERHGLAPHKDRGQNFLFDPERAAALADSAGVAPDETVIEVGTGLGILTRALAERAARVVTVEVDAGLVRVLRAESLLPEGVELVHADARDTDLPALAAPGAPVRVVANLPYSVATPLLRRLIDWRTRLRGWSVLIQKELAGRMSASPGDPGYGSFAVLHALTTDVRRGLDLAPGCFYPVPRVVSTFVHVTPREPAPDAAELRRVEHWLRAAFGQRRKTVVRALAGTLDVSADAVRAALSACDLSPTARAEDIAPALWPALSHELDELAGEADP
ncbi:MAG: 16S rRNA (adenine(1518)-N(6)/adenine(1519)-N(6))-dimethyltransferase RsmA [Myxococcota bacterium]|nr:16S rRNA (adenine(1518)-N(6)/adenine(1519)-N(6))-dimethyltransferase RsmA [Myxococcota bacterium]